MASVSIVSPGPRERVSGTVDVVVAVVADGGRVGAVQVVIGPASYGTRTAQARGEGRYAWSWRTDRKLVDPDVAAPGDAVFWLRASAEVDGAVVQAPAVAVVTANGRGTGRSAAEGSAAEGSTSTPRRGGWRPGLAWAADYSGSLERWRASHSAVVGDQRSRLVDDPVLGAARRVLRVDVPDSLGGGEDQPTRGTVRFQSSSPRTIGEGDELCVGFAVMLPEDFPTVYPQDDPGNPSGRATGYVALFQVYGPPYVQGSPLVLHADRRTPDDPLDELTIKGNELNPGDPDALLALPYRRGVWTDVVLRLRASSRIEDGWVETWVNQGGSAGVRPLTLDGVGVRVPRVLLREDSQAFRTDLQVYRVRGRIEHVGLWFAGHRVAATVAQADPGSYARGDR